MSDLLGTEEQQYNRTFDINSSANRGNALVLADGRSISGGGSRRRRRRRSLSRGLSRSQSRGLSRSQSRGLSRSQSRGQSRGLSRSQSRGQGRSRSSRGGFLGPVLNQAAVPLTLFGLNYYINKKRGHSRR